MIIETPIGPLIDETIESTTTETATGGAYVSNISFPPPISLSTGYDSYPPRVSIESVKTILYPRRFIASSEDAFPNPEEGNGDNCALPDVNAKAPVPHSGPPDLEKVHEARTVVFVLKSKRGQGPKELNATLTRPNVSLAGDAGTSKA